VNTAMNHKPTLWYIPEGSNLYWPCLYSAAVFERLSHRLHIRLSTHLTPGILILTTAPLFFHCIDSPLGPWPQIFSFMIILQMVGLLGKVISSPKGLCLNTGQHKHRINTYTYQTSMPYVGFEPMIPASERANTVHALDRGTTVTGAPVIPHENSDT
jgi:hypothetical protein